MVNLAISVPSDVPAKPYTAPDLAFLPLWSFAYSTATRSASRYASARPGLAFGRVMQKCRPAGICRAIMRQPWAMSESLTR